MQSSRIPINLAKLELQKIEHSADLSRIYRISFGKTRQNQNRTNRNKKNKQNEIKFKPS